MASEKGKLNFKNSKSLIKIILFFILSLANSFLALLYFFVQIGIVGLKFLKARIPIEVKEDFKIDTLVYKKSVNKELKMDFYIPNKNRKKYPVILYSHGGGWISGFRNQPNNVSWCKYLASKGYVVASIDYSFGFQNHLKDILKDYEDSISFLRSQRDVYKLDLKNIFLMGLSAGGHLALLYSSYYTSIDDSEKIQGVKGIISYYSPSDLKTIGDKEHKSIFAKYAIWTTMKGSLEEKEAEYERFSPINYISSRMIPIFIAHGKMDQTVPFKNSTALARKLDRYRVPYKFLVHRKADHCFDFYRKDPRTIYIVEETARFIERRIQDEY